MKREKVMLRLKRPLTVDGRKHEAGDWVRVKEHHAARYIARDLADYGEDWEATADKHILMVSAHNCTRVAKQAHALRGLGYRVDSLSSGIPAIPSAFDVLKVVPRSAFPDEIRSSGARIIHVHNEPDSLMRDADAGANGRPIVFDCHDLEYHRFGKVTDDEAFAFSRADGIISTSKPYRDLAYELHPWSVPDAVTHSCAPKAWVPEGSYVLPDDFDNLGKQKPRKGVVYEGGSSPNNEKLRWRDHVQVAAAFEAAGIPFDMYVPMAAAAAYPRARLMVPFGMLLKVLTRYEWGFLGLDIPHPKWEVVMPNKLFEYLMAGTPILACNAPAVEEYMGGRAGVYADNMDDLIKGMRSADWKLLQAEAIAARRFMDDEVRNTIMVYDALLGTYKCPTCGKTFKNRIGLEGHTKIGGCGEDASFTCEACSRTFASEAGLKAHVRMKHQE